MRRLHVPQKSLVTCWGVTVVSTKILKLCDGITDGKSRIVQRKIAFSTENMTPKCTSGITLSQNFLRRLLMASNRISDKITRWRFRRSVLRHAHILQGRGFSSEDSVGNSDGNPLLPPQKKNFGSKKKFGS